MALLCAGIYTYGVFFKPVSEEFGWPRALTSGAHSVTMFMTGLLSMVSGRLTDKLNPRFVMTVCGLLFGLGYLLMSQVSNVWQLYLFWGVMVGTGMSGGLVPMTATVARWFTKRRGLMTGIVVAGVGVGTMVSPPVATQFIANYGWRMAYMFIGAFFLVSLVLAAQFLKRDPGKIGQMPYGSNEAPGEHRSVWKGRGLSFREATHTRQFWMLCAMYIAFGTSQIAVMVHIVPYATDQQIPPIVAANIMTIIGALSLTGRVVLGAVADRIGSKGALLIGAGMVSLALLCLQFTRELSMFYLFAAIFGFGYGGEVALISPIVAELFGLTALGTTLGVVSFTYHTGCAIGPFLVGSLFDITGGYHMGFVVCLIISVIGVLLLLPLRRVSPDRPA